MTRRIYIASMFANARVIDTEIRAAVTARGMKVCSSWHAPPWRSERDAAIARAAEWEAAYHKQCAATDERAADALEATGRAERAEAERDEAYRANEGIGATLDRVAAERDESRLARVAAEAELARVREEHAEESAYCTALMVAVRDGVPLRAECLAEAQRLRAEVTRLSDVVRDHINRRLAEEGSR